MRILYNPVGGKILDVIRASDWSTYIPEINIAYQTLYVDEIPANRVELVKLIDSLRGPITLPDGTVIPRIPYTISGTTIVRSDATTWTPEVNQDRNDIDNASLYQTAQDWLQTMIDDASMTNAERDLYIRRLATILKRALRFEVRKHRAE